MSVPSHQDVSRQQQVFWKVCRFRRGVVSCVGRRPSCQDALEVRNEGRRRILWRIKELAWQEGLGTVNGVSWGEVGLVLDVCWIHGDLVVPLDQVNDGEKFAAMEFG
jgi:hypothetical protein